MSPVPEGSQNVVPTLSPLSDLTVPEGSPARFVTSFTGFPTPQISWMREGNVLRPSADFQVCVCVYENESSNVSNSLPFQMVQDNASCSLIIRRTFVEDTGIYTVRAVNGAGQAEVSAKLTVESKL